MGFLSKGLGKNLFKYLDLGGVICGRVQRSRASKYIECYQKAEVIL